MQKYITFAASALALAACATQPDAEPAKAELAAAPAAAPVTEIAWWRTGDGTFIYHQVRGDCAGVKHSHGRNGAWGIWTIPLTGMSMTQPETNGEKIASLDFQCDAGAACIGKGEFSNVKDPVTEHRIPFGTPELASALAAEIKGLQAYCANLG